MLWDNRSLLVVTHEEEAKKTPRSIVTPIVCPRTSAENGDAAVTATATAVRMIYYSRHTREGKKTKNTPRSIVTPIVCPRTWAENGDVAATTTAVCTSLLPHTGG